MTTLFNKDVELPDDNHSNEIQSYRELLVGDGKKFKDEEELAKGKYEADQFIERLLKEKEEMRKDMEARLKLEELVSKIGSNNGADTQRSQPADEGRSNENSNTNNQVDINDLIESAFNRKQTELTRQANLREVESELKKAWGSEYQTKLQKAVKDLGVSPELIDDVAARSPKAAISLLVGNSPVRQTVDASPPRTSVNTFGSSEPSSEGKRLAEYYKKLRQENPRQYWSAKTQMEIHELALAGKLPI